jgi:hypothetical protein
MYFNFRTLDDVIHFISMSYKISTQRTSLEIKTAAIAFLTP